MYEFLFVFYTFAVFSINTTVDIELSLCDDWFDIPNIKAMDLGVSDKGFNVILPYYCI